MNNTQYENEFEQRLWNNGWATFRVAGSGSVSHPSCDIIAVKDNRTLAFEVKALKQASFPYNVAQDTKQLDTIRQRGGIDVYFAVRRKGKSRGEWALYDGTVTTLFDNEEMWQFPYEVLD